MTVTGQDGSRATRRRKPATRPGVRMLTTKEIDALEPELREVVAYRKSGLSLNHVIGCPLDCGYCVRHLFKNFEMKLPRALMTDEEAVEQLVGHRFFTPHHTPIQVFNRATDPMVQIVKPNTFRTLQLLDDRGLNNHVLVITRYRVDPEDCAVLNSYRNIKVTLLVTHSGIDDERIEPVDSGIAARTLQTAFEHAENYKVVLYWRPIVPGLNDSDEHLARAHELSRFAHSTVFTGLFFKGEIRQYFLDNGLPDLYDEIAARKFFPQVLEERILSVADRLGQWGSPLFRKTSCGVTYAHGLADYNGHFGIRELCDICPSKQVNRCAEAWLRPDERRAAELARSLGGTLIGIDERAVQVGGIPGDLRNFMQHDLGYQVHDVERPHHLNRHGRADLGWPTVIRETAS